MIDKQIQPPEPLPMNIANIQQHHEGKYTCVATNGLGIGKKSIYITVLCKFIFFFQFSKTYFNNILHFLNEDKNIRKHNNFGFVVNNQLPCNTKCLYW